MIKLVVVDLDNTLLRSDKTLSDYTNKVFLEIRKKGVQFVLNTARNDVISIPILKKINASGLICCNGAVLYFNDKQIARYTMDTLSVAWLFVEIGKIAPGRNWSVTYADSTYSNYNDPNFVQVNSSDALPMGDVRMIIVRNVSVEEYQALHRVIRDKFNAIQVEKGNVIVTDLKACKDKAVNYIMNYCGIPADEVVAFGDDVNDIAFMRRAGISVAVENAKDAVKLIADDKCPSNDCDGVAKWLARYFQIDIPTEKNDDRL